MAAKDVQGRFVWYDLVTTDPEATQSFYREVTGWGTMPWEGAEEPYTMWTNGEAPIGGIMRLPAEAAAAGAPPHWLPYIATTDVDATTARAVELGGAVIVPPTDIPTAGRYAVLSDPQGAVFAVFTPESDASGHDGAPAVGEFSWHELATTDHEGAFAFYADLFGWEKTEAMDMGDTGVYQMYGRKGRTLGGIFNKSADMPGPPAWTLYVRVADLHQAVRKVRAQGGQVLNGPMEVPGGDWIAQCMDPEGAVFAVHHSVEAGPAR